MEGGYNLIQEKPLRDHLTRNTGHHCKIRHINTMAPWHDALSSTFVASLSGIHNFTQSQGDPDRPELRDFIKVIDQHSSGYPGSEGQGMTQELLRTAGYQTE